MIQAIWGGNTFTTVCVFLIVLLSFQGLEYTAVATPGTERVGVGAQDVVSTLSFAAFTSVLLILIRIYSHTQKIGKQT